MTTMTCLHCGAPTTNGLALCELCQRYATTSLEYLPVYFRNLSRWRRPARPNGSLGTTGQWMLKRGESEASRIDNALDAAGNFLSGRVRELADDRPGYDQPEQADDEAATVAAICWSLNVNLTTISTLEWCGDFVRDVGFHERALRGLTEASVPGWYAGECKRVIDDVRCGAATHVVPGLTWVTCDVCGSTTYARDHIDTVLDEAQGWIAAPKAIAEAIVALVDGEGSVMRVHERIRKWEQRGRLTATRKRDKDGDEVGPKRYRLGDVMALLVDRASEVEGIMSA